MTHETYDPNRIVPVEYRSHPMSHLPVNLTAGVWELAMSREDYEAHREEVDGILATVAHVTNHWHNADGSQLYWQLHWFTKAKGT